MVVRGAVSQPGRRIFRALRMLGLSTSIVFACGFAEAQPDTRWLTADPKVLEAAQKLRRVVETIALSVVAADTCAAGDLEPWLRTLGAIEARYSYCVEEDAGWAALKHGLDKEEQEARKSGLRTGAPMLLFMRMVDARGSRALDEGMSFCTRQPWKLLLDPQAVTSNQLRDAERTVPAAELERALSLMTTIRSLAINPSWIHSPCSQNFWPAGFLSGM